MEGVCELGVMADDLASWVALPTRERAKTPRPNPPLPVAKKANELADRLLAAQEEMDRNSREEIALMKKAVAIDDSPDGHVLRTLQVFQEVEDAAENGVRYPPLVDAEAWFFNYDDEHRDRVRARDPDLVARVLERMVRHWKHKRKSKR